MSSRSFFFAGGGTGGHIYPGIAVAEQIVNLEPAAKVHFFCSGRDIDAYILSRAGFEYTVLGAVGFTLRPRGLVRFVSEFLESTCVAREQIAKSENATMAGVGGFVAAPACRAAHSLDMPVVLISPDVIPGRANRLIGARWADEILVQFRTSVPFFGKGSSKVKVVGCPLRSGFLNPQPEAAVEQLGLNRHKYVLLITGASSGARSINETICSLLERISGFANRWQIVHLAGRSNVEAVRDCYASADIESKVVDYFDNMADLLSAAELVVGRSGAISVAEYAAAGVPSICIPYPHHRDRHQYFNAEQLVNAGAAIVVDDLPDAWERGEWLWEELRRLMEDKERRAEMRKNCTAIANREAAVEIAKKLLSE